MDSKQIFRNVNIDSINFINNRNDIKMNFTDTLLGSGKFCGSLVCIGIKVFNMTTCEDDDLEFPQIICDVIITKENEKMCVSLLGGNYEFEVVCTDININRIDPQNY